MTNLSPIEFEHEDFDLGSLEDELRVDSHCQTLLNHYYHYLQLHGKSAQQASDLAFCADYYVRDYVVDFSRQNLMRPEPGLVNRFAATWYITHTLDPEMPLLERHLEAIDAFYSFLHSLHYISQDELDYILEEVSRKDYYSRRIESFLAIKGDGYISWEAECPLRPNEAGI